jgi:hypothetical protein
MLFMVVERFRTPGAREVYRRARDKGRTALGSATFDLPTTTTRVVLRTTFMDQTSEKTFDLK